MSSNHAFVGLGIALIAIGVTAMIGCSSGCHFEPFNIHFNGGTYVNGVKLEHERTIHFSSPERPERFTLDLSSASISVEADAGVAGVEAEIEVREFAQDDASLVASKDSIETRSAAGKPVLITSAKVRVPPGTAVHVATDFGRVTVRGIRGAAEVWAASDSGRIELADLADVPAVTGRSSFGKVSLENGTNLAVVTLSTDSGAVSVKKLQGARTASLKSSFGAVEAEDASASESMDLETDSGSVTVTNVQTGRATLKSSFGSIRATQSTFDHVYAHTSSGGVKLTGCTYKTKDLDTGFGKVSESD